MTVRRSVQDFIAAINAQTPGPVTGATYSATILASGWVQVTQTLNGVSTVLHKVLWNMGVGQARTDLNPTGDTVVFQGAETKVGDAQLFIQSLN